MFLGRKNQYCENDYTTKCNLQIQYDPYQIINGIFHCAFCLFVVYSKLQNITHMKSFKVATFLIHLDKLW